MKLELKPGVSPAYFWATIGLGAASTAASALALTSYAWAGMAGALIALIVGFVRNNVKPPPGAALLLLLAFCLLFLPSCSSFTKQDARDAGEQIGLAAADAAIVIARMQLASAEAELSAAAMRPGADQRVILAKQLGVIAARKALDEAEEAIAKQRAKSAKSPVTVWSGDNSSPLHTAYPSGRKPEAASTSQSRECGALSLSPQRCAECYNDNLSPLHDRLPRYGTRVAAHLAIN